jgi:hypothetical protein
VENPGCGIFMPEASFIGLMPKWLLLCHLLSWLHQFVIPRLQSPAYQAKASVILMQRCLHQLRLMDFHSVSLTVTKNNRRAYDWYRHLGFTLRKEFGAYVWER